MDGRPSRYVTAASQTNSAFHPYRVDKLGQIGTAGCEKGVVYRP